MEGNFRSAQAHGSWLDITPDEIKRLIAMLIYFGLARIGNVDKYWSLKTLYHGLWGLEPDLEPLWL